MVGIDPTILTPWNSSGTLSWRMAGGWSCAQTESAHAKKQATFAGIRLVAAPAVVLASAQAAEVDDHGYYQDDQVDAFHGPVRVDHPGVGQRGQRQEKETEQRDQQSVIGALQVVREQPERHQRDPRKCQHYNHNEAGHRTDCRRFAARGRAVRWSARLTVSWETAP